MVLSSSSPGWSDFPLEKDDTSQPITNLTGSEHMICEFQKKHELDYTTKTAAVRKQVADRRKAMNEKNVRTTLDNTADDIQEARDDNGCDDAEEEDDNEEYGEGPGMLQQECKTRWSSTHATGDSFMTMPQFPRLVRLTRQYLSVPVSSTSPERLFSSVGLVKSDFRGRLLDTTLIDVMCAKQAP
jgi:hypothetical protein